MKIEEAIREAVEYETRILEIYTQAKQTVADARGKKVVGMLADEERGHVAYLQEKLKQWQDQGELHFDTLHSRLPTLDSIRTETGKIADQFSGNSLAGERQILERALKAEIETILNK